MRDYRSSNRSRHGSNNRRCGRDNSASGNNQRSRDNGHSHSRSSPQHPPNGPRAPDAAVSSTLIMVHRNDTRSSTPFPPAMHNGKAWRRLTRTLTLIVLAISPMTVLLYDGPMVASLTPGRRQRHETGVRHMRCCLPSPLHLHAYTGPAIAKKPLVRTVLAEMDDPSPHCCIRSVARPALDVAPGVCLPFHWLTHLRVLYVCRVAARTSYPRHQPNTRGTALRFPKL